MPQIGTISTGATIGTSAQKQACQYQGTLTTTMSLTCQIEGPSPSSHTALVDIQAPSDSAVVWQVQNNVQLNAEYNGIVYNPTAEDVVPAGGHRKFQVEIPVPYQELDLMTQLLSPSTNIATIQFNF